MNHKTNKHQSVCQPATLLATYDADNERFRQRVGKDRSPNSYTKLLQGRNYVAAFLVEGRHVADIALNELTPDFISDFCTYLSAERRLLGGTVWLACQLLKGVVTRAYQRGYISQNPFHKFHVSKNIRPREFLTEEEIHHLMTVQLNNPAQEFARDLFAFSCLTGLSYIDIQELTADDVVSIGGQTWIVSRRHKTRIPYQVKLLGAALTIVRHYQQESTDRHVFGRMNYRTVANHVATVMKTCGFRKHITFHCARHSFAVLALDKGMPIESVSRILGHTNISTTQIYAKITLQKLSRDFDQMEQRMQFLPERNR